MNIAANPGPDALGLKSAAPPPSGDSAAGIRGPQRASARVGGTSAERAARFQSLVDERAAADTAATDARERVRAGMKRPAKSSARGKDDDEARPREGDEPGADTPATPAALPGLNALPQPIDLSTDGTPGAAQDTVVGEGATPAGAVPEDADASGTIVTLPPSPPAAAPPLAMPQSTAGRALARALSALAPTSQAQAPPPVAGTPAPPLTDAVAADATAQPTDQSMADVPADSADTYTFGAAARAVEAQNLEAAAAAGRERPGSADAIARSAQAASPTRTTEVDPHARLSSPPSSQAPVRIDALQIQPVQRGEQGSIGLATPIAAPADGEGGTVADQIVKAIRIQVRDGIGEARLRLQPGHMGEIYIELRVDRDRVTAVLLVERPDVRAQIEAQGQTLRAGLAAQGLQLEELTVRDDRQKREGDGHAGQQPPDKRRRQSTSKQFELDDQ